MKILNIIHQQIAQLKWHILACFGLVMVLPLENAIVNYNDGDGFYADTMVIVSVIISILLAGLIACSNVQADFKERRYSFWRSKPINAKLFIVLKYFTGLFIAMFIMLSPVVFYYACVAASGAEPIDPIDRFFVIIAAVIALMAYSFCFACNILVRKTARSWLIGLTLTCLVLLLPFILPFNYRLAEDDHGGFFLKVLVLIIAGGSVGAFVFAILAADRNWHLRTNLKGLLWVAAVLLFSLMLLFSTQIANIKVLDEKEVPFARRDYLTKIDGRILLRDYGFVDVANGQISLQEEFERSDFRGQRFSTVLKAAQESGKVGKNEGEKSTRVFKKVFYGLGDDLYSLEMIAFYNRLSEARQNYKNAYLIRHRVPAERPEDSSILDLSDCAFVDLETHTGMSSVVMRKFGDKLVMCVNESVVSVDLSKPKELVRLDKKYHLMKYNSLRLLLDNKERRIALVPIDGISMDERIRFSIDLQLVRKQRSFGYSCVDIKDDKIIFGLFQNDIIYKCEVTKFDEKWIYYKTTSEREFTILETSTRASGSYTDSFVKDDRLYAWNVHELLVFDIRSASKIRKLGHFVRNEYTIQDVEVLDDGNILMAVALDKRIDDRNFKRASSLVLLKKP